MFRAWLLVAVAACGDASAKDAELAAATTPPERAAAAAAAPSDKLNPRLLRRFKPLESQPAPAGADAARIELGKQLFFDPRLSRDKQVSCASCHPLSRGGADGTATSVGVGGAHTTRNAPTVFNATRHVAQFWDGRATTLQKQATGPLLADGEMGMMEPKRVTAALRAIPGYAPAFAAAFPGDKEPVDFEHATEAIATFESTLITPGRWDRFLAGDRKALTSQELDGLRVFADLGCVQCHTGDLVGGLMFQKLGQAVPWPNQKDQGRYDLTKDAADRMVFKVPSLRNVALTAPYFHDGSVSDLGEAIKAMGAYQLGIDISDAEVKAIRAWFDTLTGEPASRDVKPPTLPN